MLYSLIFTFLCIFTIFYILKNNGYIKVNQNFDIKNTSLFQTLMSNLIEYKDGILKKNNTKKIVKVLNEKGIITKKKPKNIFLDIEIGKNKIGRIEIELYDNIVPKTCNNFRSLCEQKMYKNILFHRIIKGFMIQSGDFTKGNGTGGRSIYGENFDDENFIIKHNKKGIISMANKGPNTNNSQFFIIQEPQPSLDNKHVAFGCVINGLEIVDKLNSISTDYNSKPDIECTIKDCGII